MIPWIFLLLHSFHKNVSPRPYINWGNAVATKYKSPSWALIAWFKAKRCGPTLALSVHYTGRPAQRLEDRKCWGKRCKWRWLMGNTYLIRLTCIQNHSSPFSSFLSCGIPIYPSFDSYIILHILYMTAVAHGVLRRVTCGMSGNNFRATGEFNK